MVVNIKGFTLIEMMIVVAIIAILAGIAIPNYQSYVIKTKRADMMAEMQNIASQIQAKKLVNGSFARVDVSSLKGNYPKGNALYTVDISPSPLSANWVITATPIGTGQMATDGILTLDAKGKKCRNSSCGLADEWRK